MAEALGLGLYEIGFADGTLAADGFDERARRYLWSCVLGLAARGERFRTAQDAVERVQLLMRMAVMPAAKFPTLGSFLA